MTPLVIYHANCLDGAGAAFAAWMKFQDSAEYKAAQYGDLAPTDDEIVGRPVYVLDFSYPRSELERMSRSASQLLVIDHHKTAKEDCYGLPFCWFDLEQSGAVMAWKMIQETTAVPWLFKYIEDRDLWRWKLRNSREASAALEASGARSDFRVLTRYMEAFPYSTPDQWVVDIGTGVLSYQGGVVDAICRNALEVEIAGYKVLSANTPVLQSEVGERLADGRPFGVAWFVNKDGRSVISLRSRAPHGIDVSAIAKEYGGGGHPAAAGFVVDHGWEHDGKLA